MKWRELVEGQSAESSFIALSLLQYNNDAYQKMLKYIMDRADEDISYEVLWKIRNKLKEKNVL